MNAPHVWNHNRNKTGLPPHFDQSRPIPARKVGFQPEGLSYFGLIWRFIAVLIIDGLIFALQLSLIDETIDSLGLEVDRILEEVVLLQLFFQAVPDLTSRELLSAVISLLLVGSGIAAWSLAITGFQLARQGIAGRILTGFIIFCFVISLVTEWMLVWTRVQLAMGSAFHQPGAINEGTAFFFSLVFLVAANAAACLTAVLLQAIKSRKGTRS